MATTDHWIKKNGAIVSVIIQSENKLRKLLDTNFVLKKQGLLTKHEKKKFLDLFCIDVSDDHGEAWYRSDSCQMIIILYHDEDDDHLMLMIMITI